jgi:hypothetical protein
MFEALGTLSRQGIDPGVGGTPTHAIPKLNSNQPASQPTMRARVTSSQVDACADDGASLEGLVASSLVQP